MPKGTNKENLLELEKLVKKILRKSLKDNTLDYTVQYSISSVNPGEVKYAAQITAPKDGVQPITFIFDSYNDLKNALTEAVDEIDAEKVELIFHRSRINSYKSKIASHEKRMDQIEKGETVDEVPMEEV